MSAEALRWAKRVKAGGPGPKAVLVILADYADEAHSCYPGQKLLAETTEQGERTVRRQLAAMEEAGLIRRVHRAKAEGKGRSSDRFYLLVDQPANLAAPESHRPSETDLPATHDVPTGQALAGDLSREPQVTTSATASPLAESADRIARAEWERRDPKPVGGKFPGFRSRILEQLQAGRSEMDLTLMLPSMTTFTRDAFDYAAGKVGAGTIRGSVIGGNGGNGFAFGQPGPTYQPPPEPIDFEYTTDANGTTYARPLRADRELSSRAEVSESST